MDVLSRLRAIPLHVLAIGLLSFCTLAGILALPDSLRLAALGTLFASCAATVLSQALLDRQAGRKAVFSKTALISGLIIGSILPPDTLVGLVVLVGALAMLLKRLIRIRGSPLFNPAALGLVSAGAAFGIRAGWWAAAPTPALIGLQIASLVILGWKLGKFILQAAFLLAWLAPWGVIIFLAGTAPPLSFFFGLIPFYLMAFMLLEPMTSPLKPSWQLVYGGFVALVAFAIPYANVPADALLLALLAGNALTKALALLPVPAEKAQNANIHAEGDEVVEISIGKADLKPGERRCVDAGGKKLALANINGKYCCIDNLCTHAGGPLCEGGLDKTGFGLVCPWHGSIFDMRNGKVIHGPAIEPVKFYALKEKGGELFIRL